MTERLLKDKIAIVTGGSSGIGRAIALRFADEGSRVVVASRDLGRCEKVVAEIAERGHEALAVSCDARDEMSVIALFDRAESEFGGVDIVVASAGVTGGKEVVENYPLERWNEVIAGNLTSVFLTGREAFRRIKKRGGGHIVVISSEAGVIGYGKKGAYAAAKFGARGFANVLGEEGRSHNINVSTICPGMVDTPILAASGSKAEHPMSTDAVADAAVYLSTLRGNALVRDILLERRIMG